MSVTSHVTETFKLDPTAPGLYKCVEAADCYYWYLGAGLADGTYDCIWIQPDNSNAIGRRFKKAFRPTGDIRVTGTVQLNFN